MIKGLYIHIPFCKRICSYCDFNKRVSSLKMMEDYKDALINEINHNKPNYQNLETIYIGGGTPSFYPFIENILDSLKDNINLVNIKEFTIESTLETVLNLVPYIEKYHINRISIGIESFNELTLKYINRPIYSKSDTLHKFKVLRDSGIKNINIDLISGLPFETYKSLKSGFKMIKIINPDHISYYDLIIEDKTILSHDIKLNKIKPISEDESYRFSKYINKSLKSLGYKRYEFSNYSKKNMESFHNLLYWNLDDYLGLGVNSHSLVEGKRFYNTESIIEYIKNPLTSKKEEDVNLEKEYLLMGLRKIDGISIKKYNELFNKNIFNEYDFINKFIKEGLLKIRGDFLSFTKKGIDLSNIVYREIV